MDAELENVTSIWVQFFLHPRSSIYVNINRRSTGVLTESCVKTLHPYFQ